MTTPVVLCQRWSLLSTLTLSRQLDSTGPSDATEHLRDLLTMPHCPNQPSP